jgi:hypothetical protein
MRLLTLCALTLMAACAPPSINWQDDEDTQVLSDSDSDSSDSVSGSTESDSTGTCGALPDLGTDCVGGLGCPCDDGVCAENLECKNGVCISCPAGQIDCPCAGGACDTELICVDGVCQPMP